MLFIWICACKIYVNQFSTVQKLKRWYRLAESWNKNITLTDDLICTCTFSLFLHASACICVSFTLFLFPCLIFCTVKKYHEYSLEINEFIDVIQWVDCVFHYLLYLMHWCTSCCWRGTAHPQRSTQPSPWCSPPGHRSVWCPTQSRRPHSVLIQQGHRWSKTSYD